MYHRANVKIGARTGEVPRSPSKAQVALHHFKASCRIGERGLTDLDIVTSRLSNDSY